MQGTPIWYELGTSDLDGAKAFYAAIFGWSVEDAGMQGFTYLLASCDADMIAGLMSLGAQTGAPPPNWTIYFAVDDCDAVAARTEEAGGRVYHQPADIPGTGRFAVLADPQGAVFGILQPLPMAEGADGGRAFDQQKEGHGNWNELMTSDPGRPLPSTTGFSAGRRRSPSTWAIWASIRSSRTMGRTSAG